METTMEIKTTSKQYLKLERKLINNQLKVKQNLKQNPKPTKQNYPEQNPN